MIKLWIINVHTRACFGPYEARDEAQHDIDNDPHPQDWVIVKPLPKARGKK